jgi:hypothetical protein
VVHYRENDESWLVPGNIILVELSISDGAKPRVTRKSLTEATPQEAFQRLRERIRRWTGW